MSQWGKKFPKSIFVDQTNFNRCLFHYVRSASSPSINVTTRTVIVILSMGKKSYSWEWESVLRTKIFHFWARKSRHLWSTIPPFGFGEVLIFLIKHKIQTLSINNFLKWSKKLQWVKICQKFHRTFLIRYVYRN